MALNVTMGTDPIGLCFWCMMRFFAIIAATMIWSEDANSQTQTNCVFYQTLVDCSDSGRNGTYHPGMTISSRPLPVIPFFAVGKDYTANELEALSFFFRNEDSSEAYYLALPESPDFYRITSRDQLRITENTKEHLKAIYDRSLGIHFGDFRPVEEVFDGENIKKFWETWNENLYQNDCILDCPTVIQSIEDRADPQTSYILNSKYGEFQGGVSYCREHRIANNSLPPRDCKQIIRYHLSVVLIRAAVETWRTHESVPRYGDIDFKCSINSDDLPSNVGKASNLMKNTPYLLRANQRKLTNYVFGIVGLRRFENSILFSGYRELTSVETLIFSNLQRNGDVNVEVTIGLHLTKLNSTDYTDYRIADAGHQVLYANSLIADFESKLGCNVTWSR